MTFIPAYDVRTGKKLPYHVPSHLIDHPVWGKHLRATPRGAKTPTGSKPVDKTPAAGDNPTKEK